MAPPKIPPGFGVRALCAAFEMPIDFGPTRSCDRHKKTTHANGTPQAFCMQSPAVAPHLGATPGFNDQFHQPQRGCAITRKYLNRTANELNWSETGLNMKTIAFTEAKATLSELIDRVAGGEEITITRHSEPVAKLVPAKRSSNEDMKRLVDEILASRKRSPKVTLKEIIQWKNTGRP